MNMSKSRPTLDWQPNTSPGNFYRVLDLGLAQLRCRLVEEFQHHVPRHQSDLGIPDSYDTVDDLSNMEQADSKNFKHVNLLSSPSFESDTTKLTHDSTKPIQVLGQADMNSRAKPSIVCTSKPRGDPDALNDSGNPEPNVKSVRNVKSVNIADDRTSRISRISRGSKETTEDNDIMRKSDASGYMSGRISALKWVLPNHLNHLIHSIRRGELGKEDVKHVYLYIDVFSCILILCNLAAIGWKLQHHYITGDEPELAPRFDLAFCVALAFELILRLTLERRKFFAGVNKWWNCFDTVVLLGMTTEYIMERTTKSTLRGVTTLRALNLLRLVRIIRILKVFRFVRLLRSGRLIMMAIRQGYVVIVWVGLLGFSFSYLFALVIATRTKQDCYADIAEDQLLCKHFGSLWRSCSSIYQALLSGMRWGALFEALQVVESIYSAALLVLVTFFYCVILQIVTGIFVVQVMRQDKLSDKSEKLVSAQKTEKENFFLELDSCFRRLDLNSNGVLCKDELNEMFNDESMSTFLSQYLLDTTGAETLFELLDGDDSGYVDFDEFAAGCMRYRGQARAIDLERVRRDIVQIQSSLASFGDGRPMARTTSRPSVLNSRLSSSQIVERTSCKSSDKPFSLRKTASESQSLLRKISTRKTLSNSTDNRDSLANSIFNKQATPIPRTEMRAMLLDELLEVVALIRFSCDVLGWVDMAEESLTPDQVNLYHFNNYVISPRTAAPSITLAGLVHGSYPAGETVIQRRSSDNTIIGKAIVVSDFCGTDIKVKIVYGMFFPQFGISLDDGTDCGAPHRIQNNGNTFSYKELISTGQARPDWFCSHWWGEPIFDFVRCCREHSKWRQKDKYWVCAYANQQHELSSDISDNPEETSFRRAMALAEGVLLVLDSHATPFRRIWCDFELFKTISEGKKLDIATYMDTAHILSELPFPGEEAYEKTRRERHFPLQLLLKGLQVELEKGDATMEQDKTNILNVMGRDETGLVNEDLLERNVENANSSLRGYFALAAWPQALKRGLVRDFAFGAAKRQGHGVNLARVLAADEGRTSLQLTMSSFEEMTDIEMKSISECLPPNLTHLKLSLEDCPNITDVGFVDLAISLQTLPLQKLELDFVSCKNLTDASLCGLASRLPSTLVDMKVNFGFCKQMSKAGVRQLAKQLPSSLKNLSASFKGTECNEVYTSVNKFKKI